MIRLLVAKDLRVLRRSPGLLALVVLYPVLVAVGLGLALTREAPSPRIAVVNLLPEGKDGAVEISGQTLKLADLQASLAGGKVQTVTVNTRADALRRIDRGELDGALIIPADAATRLRAQLGSGGVAEGPRLEILYRESGPLDGVLVRSLVGARLRTAERTLASEIVRVSTSFLTLLRDGGTITVFGQQVEVLGLRRAEQIVAEAARTAPASQRADLKRVETFARRARENLNLSDRILRTVAQPLQITETAVGRKQGRTLAGFAVGVAAALSLMLVAMTLGAGLLATEREEGTARRLLRGGKGAAGLVIAKIGAAGLVAAGSGVLLLSGLAVAGAIGWSGAPLWLPALLLAGGAFAGFGVLLGAVLRDARAASLAAILLAVPVAVVALIPAQRVGDGVAQLLDASAALVPFAAARELLDAAVAQQWALGSAAQLTAQLGAYALIATVLVRRARG